MTSKTISLQRVWFVALTDMLAVVAAVALPQAVHLLGGWLGMGTALGEMLLPMHLPVMLAGFIGGPVAGLVAGLVSPLVSFGLTNMPMAAMVPFMMVELMGYGVCAGLLRNRNLPAVVQVLLVQVAGRLARALVLATAVYGFGFTQLPISLIWTSIVTGLAGILLQLVLIPPLLRIVRR